MPDTLELVWRRFRLEMIALAEGGTLNFEGHVSSGKEETKAPPPAGQDLAHFEREWARARTDEERRRVLLCPDCAHFKAKVKGLKNCCVVGYLRPHKLAKADETIRGTQEWRRAMANDPRPLRTVARAYGVRYATVQAAREEFGTARRPGRPKVSEMSAKMLPSAVADPAIFRVGR